LRMFRLTLCSKGTGKLGQGVGRSTEGGKKRQLEGIF